MKKEEMPKKSGAEQAKGANLNKDCITEIGIASGLGKTGEKKIESLEEKSQKILNKRIEMIREQQAINQISEIKPEKKSQKTAFVIAGAVAAGVIALGGIIYAARSYDSNPTSNLRTPTTGAATGTPAPRPENVPLVVENNSALERIGTPEEAVRRFGADSYSRNPANWTIGESGNAATLNTPSDGTVTRTNSNGAVVEGWIGAKELKENTSFDAIIILAGPNQKQLDLRGGTFRIFKDPIRGYQELKAKLIAKENAEQPGTIVFESCSSLDISTSKWANTVKLGSLIDVAQRFGVDSYSRNPANWELIENGNGAHLKISENGYVTRIKLSGNAVAEGYVNAPTRPENTNFGAISFVAHPSQGFVDGQGFTVREFENADAGFTQLAGQHLKVEKVQQPGIVTLLLGKCAIVEPPCIPCTKKETPTPEVAPCAWANTAEEAASIFGMDEYSKNPIHWRAVEGNGWNMEDNNREHWVNFGGCYIAEGYIYVVINKIDPMQTIITTGKEALALQGVTIWKESGEQAANNLYNKYVKSHPNDILPVRALGFTPNLNTGSNH